MADNEVLPIPVGFAVHINHNNDTIYYYDVLMFYSLIMIFLPLSLCQLSFSVYHPEYNTIYNSIGSINVWFLYESSCSMIYMVYNLIFFYEYKKKKVFQVVYNSILAFQVFWLIVGSQFFFNTSLPAEVYSFLWLSLTIGFGKILLQLLVIAKYVK
jgi:hypothetical protein